VTILNLGWDITYPGVLIRKKNGDLRFCVDYRKLKDATKENCSHCLG
jgi:hypothetical protein